MRVVVGDAVVMDAEPVLPRKGRPAKPACPWSQDGTSALLAHLQRLTDAVERVEAAQQALEAALKARGAL